MGYRLTIWHRRVVNALLKFRAVMRVNDSQVCRQVWPITAANHSGRQKCKIWSAQQTAKTTRPEDEWAKSLRTRIGPENSPEVLSFEEEKEEVLSNNAYRHVHRMEYKKKRKKDDEESDSSVNVENESYLVGMLAITQVDGIFKDPHEVGRFVGKELGKVRAVKVTRSGLVIIECISKLQQDKALEIKEFGEDSWSVKCFPLSPKGERKRKKGVISSVPLSFKEDSFLSITGACEATRLTQFRDGVKEDSTSICLTFEGELPDRVFMDYVCYRVRPFERAPMRCFSCQEYGHTAAVCRGVRKCVGCGEPGCCKEACLDKEEPACLHCKGDHYVGSAKCPKRVAESTIYNLRMEKNMTYAEAEKTVHRKEELKSLPNEDGVKCERNISMDKKSFLAFIAMVVNCAVEVEGKSERIKMVLDAAKRFLKIDNITGEDLDSTLREGFAQDMQ